MAQDRWTEVDRYIADLFIQSDPVMDATLRSSSEAGLPPIHVSPPQGRFLMLLAMARGARRILEIGTLAGYSTIWLARALPVDGRLVSLEIDREHASIARANIARAGLSGRVTIRVGSALETLPKLLGEGQGPFDFVFIDADKPSYPDYLEWAIKLGRPGTVIVADNVVREGEIIKARSTDPNTQGIRRFNDALATNDRVIAIEIQTVGSKGYDGFAVALVK